MKRIRASAILFLVSLLATGCATAQALPSSTPPSSPTARPEPTSSPTPAVTLTSTPSPTPVSLPPGREIILEESNNRNFTGTVYGEGETAIILANMDRGGEIQWSPFVAAVDKHSFTTVTFNYRSINSAEQDTRIVLEALRKSGYKRIICIGASLGVTSCSRLANEPEIVGIVLIAGRMIRGSLSEVTYPKLFIAGALDPITPYTQTGYEQSAEPKELVLFEENRAHANHLFSSKDGVEFLNVMIEFVDSLADR